MTCSSSYACFGWSFSRDPCDGFRLELKDDIYMLFKLKEASLKKCILSGIILSYWPGVNYIHGYMTRGADLRLSIYSSRSRRGHQTFIIYAKKWNWLFLQKRYKNFELWSVQKNKLKKSLKKVVIGFKKKFEKSCDWFKKKQIEKSCDWFKKN